MQTIASADVYMILVCNIRSCTRWVNCEHCRRPIRAGNDLAVMVYSHNGIVSWYHYPHVRIER